MSDPNDTPRYDVTTEDDGGVYFGFGSHTHTTTIRDNETGQEYTAINYDAQASRDAAWDQVDRDR
jgi:hypothetical protein